MYGLVCAIASRQKTQSQHGEAFGKHRTAVGRFLGGGFYHTEKAWGKAAVQEATGPDFYRSVGEVLWMQGAVFPAEPLQVSSWTIITTHLST